MEKRSYKYKTSFDNKKCEHSRTLSQYMWNHKKSNQNIPKIIWKVRKEEPTYKNTTKHSKVIFA